MVVEPYDDDFLVSRISCLAVEQASEAEDARPAAAAPASARPREGSSGFEMSRLRIPSALPAPVVDLADRVSDAWFITKLFVKDKMRQHAARQTAPGER